jgi:CRISPR-associated protein Csm2
MFDKTLIQNWIQNGITKDTVEKAKQYGEKLVNPTSRRDDSLTTSQIRNVFGELRRIQLNGYKNEKTAFLLIKPKLAYAVKRHRKKGIELFYELFSIGYDSVDTNKDEEGTKHFENLMNFMEAVLAYHKFHGGKE